MNHQYACISCGKHITLPANSKFCPICGGEVVSKAKIFANERCDQLKKMLPELERKYKEFADAYVDFKLINETLRCYAARGLIDREQIVDFNPEPLTDMFYRKRKERKAER